MFALLWVSRCAASLCEYSHVRCNRYLDLCLSSGGLQHRIGLMPSGLWWKQMGFPFLWIKYTPVLNEGKRSVCQGEFAQTSLYSRCCDCHHDPAGNGASNRGRWSTIFTTRGRVYRGCWTYHKPPSAPVIVSESTYSSSCRVKQKYEKMLQRKTIKNLCLS